MPRSSILTTEAKRAAIKAHKTVLVDLKAAHNVAVGEHRLAIKAAKEHSKLLERHQKAEIKAETKLALALQAHVALKGQEIVKPDAPAVPYTGKPRGRPKMTDEQKAAAKAARESASTSTLAGVIEVPENLQPLIPFKAEDAASGSTVFDTVADAVK